MVASEIIKITPRGIRNLRPLAGMRADRLPRGMFIIPHDAPEGYEWFVTSWCLSASIFRCSQFHAGAALIFDSKT